VDGDIVGVGRSFSWDPKLHRLVTNVAGLIGCPGTPRSIPEERRPQLRRGGTLNSRCWCNLEYYPRIRVEELSNTRRNVPVSLGS